MCRPFTLLLAVLCLASVPPADAQVRGLLDRAREAVAPPADDAQTTPAAQAPADAPPQSAPGSPTPAVDYADLLDTRFYPARGTFALDDVFLLFPPPGLVERGEIEGRFVIRDASGGEVARKTIARVGRTGSDAIVRLQSRGGVVDDISNPIEPGGQYTLDVELYGDLVGSVPFTVTQASNGDPYDPVSTFALEGPWRTHAYFEYEHERPDYLMHFHAWVGLGDAPSGEQTEVSVRKDGQEVAFGHGWSDTTYGWTRVEHRLFDVSARHEDFGRHQTNGMPWTIEDVTPGTYEVVLSHENGEIRRYAIEGAQGAFVDHPRSAIDFEPRAHFLGTRQMTNQNLNKAHRMFWIAPREE